MAYNRKHSMSTNMRNNRSREVIDLENDNSYIVIDDSEDEGRPAVSTRRNGRRTELSLDRNPPTIQEATAGKGVVQVGLKQDVTPTRRDPASPPKRNREQMNSRYSEHSTPHYSGHTPSQPDKPSTHRAEVSKSRSRFYEAPKSPATSRPLEVRSKVHCLPCRWIEQDCDGRNPCARCAKLKLDCAYTLATGTPVSEEPVTQLQPVSNARKKTSASPLQASNSPVSPFPLVTGRDTSKTADATVKEPPVIPEDDPEDLPLPCDPETISQTIDAIKQQLDSEREYWLQGELIRARVKAQSTPNSPSATLQQNPFRRLLAESNTESVEPSTVGYTTLSMKVGNKTSKSIKVPYRDFQVDRELPLLPKYKSMGRLGNSLMAKNSYILKVDPYFVEDESDLKFKEERDEALKTRYRNPNLGDDKEIFNETLIKQRTCLERINHWLNAFKHLLTLFQIPPHQMSDYLKRNCWSEECPSCGIDFNHFEVDDLDSSISEEHDSICQLLATILGQKIGSSVWHFNEYCSDVLNVERSAEGNESESESNSHLCAICLIPNCVLHGSYEDHYAYEFVDDTTRPQTLLMNDAESRNNLKSHVLAPNLARQSDHVCGIFCAGDTSSQMQLRDVFGIEEAATLNNSEAGISDITEELGQFKLGREQCKNHCAIDKEHREGSVFDATKALSTLKPQQIRSLRYLVRTYPNNLRLPCYVAQKMGTSCHFALQCILAVHAAPSHAKSLPTRSGFGQRDDQLRAKRRNQPIWDVSHSPWLDLRGPIFPCHHPGPCTSDQRCDCAKGSLFCEWFCGCDKTCKRRFPGCTCKGTCFRDERCICWKQNRECDPWLCHSCGVQEVLDPSNKYNEKLRKDRCRNCAAQLGIPAKTIKAESEVQGWGLYAGEDMAANTFIGDYRGEIITTEEANRRGELYHNLGQEYLFTINKKQEIDGSNYGNKTRFMNNSRLEKYINVWSHKLLANGVVRVLFFTQRNIKAGEELLYNYNYPDEVQEHFWEKGDRQKKNGVIPIPKPRVSINVTREAETEPTPRAKGKKIVSPAVPEPKKRKRPVVSNSDDELEEPNGFGENYATNDEPSSTHNPRLAGKANGTTNAKGKIRADITEDDFVGSFGDTARRLASRKGTNQKAPGVRISDEDSLDGHDPNSLAPPAEYRNGIEDEEYLASDLDLLTERSHSPLDERYYQDDDEDDDDDEFGLEAGRVRPSTSKGKRRLNPLTDKRFRQNNDRRGRRTAGR